MAQLLIYPLCLSILLLAAGILFRKNLRFSTWLLAAALCLLSVFSSSSVSRALLRSLEDQYPDRGMEAIPPAQAIVVLGGSVHAPTARHGNSSLINPSDRLLEALRLYRAGIAPLVMCTGGGHSEVPEAQAMGRLLQEWGVPSESILLEQKSLNTRENALFSYPVLNARGIRHILLVTSAMHMPRAAAVFRKAGFEVSPAPSDFRTGWGSEGGFWDWMPDAGGLHWSDMALREWLGMLVYRFRGWA
jgi:uncharacterized SAM-binding protein YcdF (DUF218 family)